MRSLWLLGFAFMVAALASLVLGGSTRLTASLLIAGSVVSLIHHYRFESRSQDRRP